MSKFDAPYSHDEDGLVRHHRVDAETKEGALMQVHKMLVNSNVYYYTIFSVQPADPDLL